MNSVLSRLDLHYEQNIRTHLALSYLRAGRQEKALEVLLNMRFDRLSGDQASDCVQVLRELYSGSNLDMDALLLRFYQEACSPKPTPKAGENRREIFVREASRAFDPQYWDYEREEGYSRSAMMLFLPLAGKCEAGTAAAVQAAESPEEMRRWLETVKRWDEFPISALNRALLAGVRFPLPDRRMTLEEMDDLCARMAVLENTPVVELALKAGNGNFDTDPSGLLWARGLLLSAVQVYDWKQEEQGMELARTFAEVERSFLKRYYAADFLREDAIQFLPKLHRFGWYCGQALDALDTGDAAGYARCLRQGLILCESMRPMVEFMLDQAEELTEPAPNPELLALAERVRMVLSAYSPEDPAVLALKDSPAYQKVAYLIEGGGE